MNSRESIPLNLLTEWSRLFAGSLAACGIEDVFVSPGSRSTPFLLALLAESKIRCHSVIDERAAAFAALGSARLSGKPAVALCTSGSAPAHYYPAVIEAYYAGVPLIVASADRARREQDSGAAQTIEQSRLFGVFARFLELGDPSPSPAAFRGMARKISDAIAATRAPHPVPLHINAPADKPLEPTKVAVPCDDPWTNLVDRTLGRFPGSIRNEPGPDLGPLANEIVSAKHPLIVAGPLNPAAGSAVAALGRHLGAQVFGEAASNVPGALPAEFGLNEHQKEADLILHFGGPLTSTRVSEFLRKSEGRRVQVSPAPSVDSLGSLDLHVLAEPDAAAAMLCSQVLRSGPVVSGTASAELLRAAIASGLANSTETGEPRCVFEALAGVPKHFPLLLGNSLSIRLTDWVFGALGELPHFFVQRGANGIDGLVAGAQGMRLMSTKGAGVLLGDVSLSHDLTSLGLFRDSKSPFVVLLLDNDGGRLFDHLPARSAVNAESDWEYFRTRPRIDWSSVARSFDIRYESPSPGALQATVAAAAIRPGVTLVHMRAEGGTKEFLARVRDELGL